MIHSYLQLMPTLATVDLCTNIQHIIMYMHTYVNAQKECMHTHRGNILCKEITH